MNHKKNGMLIIEMLLVLAMSAVLMSGISLFVSTHRESLKKTSHYQNGAILAQQQIERVKSIWADNWNNLSDGIWHIELLDDDWQIIPGDEEDGIYRRRIEIEAVYRDLTGKIATEGGDRIYDPSSKKISSFVVWEDPQSHELTQKIILTNYRHHDLWVEDSLADFSDGVEDATDYSSVPGSVVLAQTGGGGWSEPASVATADGIDDANGITQEGNYLYLALDRWPGKVQVFAIDNPLLPTPKTDFDTFWRVNDVAADGGYLYVADYTGLFFSSVSVFDIGANPESPPYLGDFNINMPARSIWVKDGLCFLSLTSFFFGNTRWVVVYDVSTDPANPAYLGYFITTRPIRSVTTSGNYLYAALDSTSEAVEIFDISVDPASPTSLGTFSTLYKPKGISADGGILYIVTENRRGSMYQLDDPTNPSLLGYFPTIQYTADIVAKGDYGFVAGSESWRDVIEVFDLADSKGISGTYFVYGEYTSSTFINDGPISFYRLYWNDQSPDGTEVRFQTAVNNDNSTWNFIGPDGTGASYFTQSGSIYYPQSIGRYMKYKVFLIGDSVITPQLDQVSVSYSK